MAVLDVEGSKFTKELTGKHKEWFLKNNKETVLLSNELFVRMDAAEVDHLFNEVEYDAFLNKWGKIRLSKLPYDECRKMHRLFSKISKHSMKEAMKEAMKEGK